MQELIQRLNQATLSRLPQTNGLQLWEDEEVYNKGKIDWQRQAYEFVMHFLAVQELEPACLK